MSILLPQVLRLGETVLVTGASSGGFRGRTATSLRDADIRATLTEGINPRGIVFWIESISGFSTQEIRECFVRWDMKNYYDFWSLADRPTASPERWFQAGHYFGPVAAHTFDTPGTYAPTCTITDPAGNSRTFILPTIEIADKATAYEHYAYMVTDNDFSGAPAESSTVTHVNCPGGVVPEGWWTSSSINNRAVLMKGGQEFDINFHQGGTDCLIGAWGEANYATIKRTGESRLFNRVNASTARATYERLRVDSGYRSTDLEATRWWEQDPAPTAPPDFLRCVRPDGDLNTTFHRLDLIGCDFTFEYTGSGKRRGEVFSDIKVRHWFNYGFYGGPVVSGRVGFNAAHEESVPRILMSPSGGVPGNQRSWNTSLSEANFAAAQDQGLTYFGPNGEAPNWPRHGPLRMTEYDRVAISHCYFGSFTGWSITSPNNSDFPNAPQPCIRMSRDSLHARLSISLTTGDGGAPGIRTPQAIYAVVEACDFLSRKDNNEAITVSYPDAVVRNCLFRIHPNETEKTRREDFKLLRQNVESEFLGENPKGTIMEHNTYFFPTSLETDTLITSDYSGEGLQAEWRNNVVLVTDPLWDVSQSTLPETLPVSVTASDFDADLVPVSGPLAAAAVSPAPFDAKGNPRDPEAARRGRLEPAPA